MDSRICSNELGYLARRFLNKEWKVQAGYSLLVHSKMSEERKKLKKELLSKKEPELGRFGKFSAYPYWKT